MIYLIDDNQSNQQQDKYGIKYIENQEFSDILISINKLDINGSLLFLKNATCIFLHTSTEDYNNGNFISGSLKNTTKIIKEISDNGDNIPLVLFSEGMNEIAIMPNLNYIRAIKKSVFYANLFDFLIDYRATNKLNFNIISYGKNYISREISEYAFKIISDLILKDQSYILKLTDIKMSYLKKIIERSDINISFDDLLLDLEDNPITIGKFVEKIKLINKSFSTYGKNIYGWM